MNLNKDELTLIAKKLCYAKRRSGRVQSEKREVELEVAKFEYKQTIDELKLIFKLLNINDDIEAFVEKCDPTAIHKNVELLKSLATV